MADRVDAAVLSERRHNTRRRGVLSTHLLNGIARCGVCGGSLGFCRKGAGRESYYCVGRGVGSGCTNARGIPEADLDRAVVNALHDLISDEDTTWALLTARADRWRAEQEAKSRADERPAIEREVERLEGAIARLTDAIEAGQPVGDRLKQRQAELDALRVKLAEPETFDPDREAFEVELARWIEPLRWTGPVVSERDPQQTRSAMRHLGVDKIIVTPEPDGGWSFAGVGDLARLVGRKGVSGLPPTPPCTISDVVTAPSGGAPIPPCAADSTSGGLRLPEVAVVPTSGEKSRPGAPVQG